MSMNGRVCVITGANSGIGFATAKALVQEGATVVVCARNPERGEQAVERLREANPDADIGLQLLDLASLASVRRGAAELLATYPQIHVLINNAGLILGDRRVTEDGFEATMGTNHLGPFLLTHLLVDRLEANAPARIVNISSVAHAAARRGLDFDDLHYERRPYASFGAYAASKLANIYFTVALARRLEGRGVTVNALHPGVIRSGFGRDGDTGSFFGTLVKIGGPLLTSPEKGARTSIYLASSDEVEGISGQYFVREKARRPAKIARDEAAAERLWRISAEATGVDPDGAVNATR